MSGPGSEFQNRPEPTPKDRALAIVHSLQAGFGFPAFHELATGQVEIGMGDKTKRRKAATWLGKLAAAGTEMLTRLDVALRSDRLDIELVPTDLLDEAIRMSRNDLRLSHLGTTLRSWVGTNTGWRNVQLLYRPPRPYTSLSMEYNLDTQAPTGERRSRLIFGMHYLYPDPQRERWTARQTVVSVQHDPNEAEWPGGRRVLFATTIGPASSPSTDLALDTEVFQAATKDLRYLTRKIPK